jgi:hypothetical protein
MVWFPIAVYAGYRALEYKGLLARTVACPGSIRILETHCGDVSELRQYVLGAFIDRSFLARFTTRPGALAALAARSGLVEVSFREVPAAVWSQAPVWWSPERDDSTRVFATAGFPHEGRGPDGDHYLFIEHGRTNRVYVMFKSNF